MKIAGAVAGISAGQGIASDNLQMVASQLDRERRRGVHVLTERQVVVVHFSSGEP